MMTGCRLTLSVLFLIFSSLLSAARTLTPAQALARVSREYNTSDSRGGISVLSTSDARLAHTEKFNGEATVYLFQKQGGGYMVVSADDCVTPLLGYSDSGVVNAGDMPENLKWWIGTYNVQIGSSRDSAGSRAEGTDDGDVADDDTLSEVEPLLTTVWGQGSPFNSYCPEIGTQRAPSGCVATALAQCMYHYKWPEHGQGRTSYISTYNSVRHTLSLDFDTITFDWDNMIPNYSLTHTYEQASAVATLMYSVGVGVHMQYNLSGSSSDLMSAAQSMIKYFDYAESVCYYEREYYELDDWKKKIHDELVAGRPVPYSGANSVEGHAFVADGYRKGGYFHFNWGWNGQYNGWFLLTSLNPKEDVLDYTAGGYDMSQAIITGFVPASKYEEPAIELRVSGNFSAQQASYVRSDDGSVTFHCQNGIFSMAYTTSTVTLGVKIKDAEGNESYAASATTNTFSRFEALQNFKVPMSALPQEGEYLLSPAFMDSIGVWHDVLIPLTNEREIELEASPTTLQFVKSDDIPKLVVTDFQLDSPLMIDEKFSVSAKIENSGSEFYDEVWPLLKLDGTVVARGPGINVDCPEGESVDVEWVGALSAVGGHTLTAGTYELVLANAVNYSYVTLSPELSVELMAKTSAPLIFDCTVVNIDGSSGLETSPSQPLELSGGSVVFNFQVSCKQGYFGQDVGVYVYEATAKEDSTHPQFRFGEKFVGLMGDQSKEVSIEADLSELTEGKVYKAEPWASTSGQLTSTPTYFRIGVAGIDSVFDDSRVISTQCFNLQGIYVGNNFDKLSGGVYLLREVHENGSVKVRKVVR